VWHCYTIGPPQRDDKATAEIQSMVRKSAKRSSGNSMLKQRMLKQRMLKQQPKSAMNPSRF